MEFESFWNKMQSNDRHLPQKSVAEAAWNMALQSAIAACHQERGNMSIDGRQIIADCISNIERLITFE